MAKKIRFPLKMDSGMEVRSLTELKEYFSIVRVMEYYENGKLVIWLRDRFENEMAEKIEKLDKSDDNLEKKVCEIFDISYEQMIKENKRKEKIEKLRKYTNDNKYTEMIDFIAFEQEEVYDLLDEGVNTIYLCGEEFIIPVENHGITFIGINNPMVKGEGDILGGNIKFFGVSYDGWLSLVCFTEEEKIKAGCTHRYQDTGLTALIEQQEQDRRKFCDICKNYIEPINVSCVKDVQDKVNDVVAILEQIKIMCLDIPEYVCVGYMSIISYIKKIPALYEIALLYNFYDNYDNTTLSDRYLSLDPTEIELKQAKCTHRHLDTGLTALIEQQEQDRRKFCDICKNYIEPIDVLSVKDVQDKVNDVVAILEQIKIMYTDIPKYVCVDYMPIIKDIILRIKKIPALYKVALPQSGNYEEVASASIKVGSNFIFPFGRKKDFGDF